MPWLELGMAGVGLAVVGGLIGLVVRLSGKAARAEEREDQSTVDAALQREVVDALSSPRDGRASDDLRRLRDG